MNLARHQAFFLRFLARTSENRAMINQELPAWAVEFPEQNPESAEEIPKQHPGLTGETLQTAKELRPAENPSARPLLQPAALQEAAPQKRGKYRLD
jgi:hypothetical protein